MSEGNPYQRTEQWFADRCGCLTASRCADALSVLKSGKPSVRRINLIHQLIAERNTNQVEHGYTSSAMQWGIDHEEDALTAYKIATGNTVEQCGFIHHPEIEWFGASPDGLVGQDGLVETKCPNSTTHLGYIKAGEIPPEYRAQLLCQLVCTGREWVDFVSYDPRFMREDLQIYICRFHPSNEERAEFQAAAVSFLNEVTETEKEILSALKITEEE